MVKIDSTTLENVQEIRKTKRRVLIEKPLAAMETAYRESNAGYGMVYEIRGIIDAASISALNTKESALQALANEYRHTLDFEDDTNTKSVIVIDPEVYEVSGKPLSREYRLICYQAHPLFKRLRLTAPTITQSISFTKILEWLMNPPSIQMAFDAWVGKILEWTQSPPTITQAFDLFLDLGYCSAGSTSYPEVSYGNTEEGSGSALGANTLYLCRKTFTRPLVVKKLRGYIPTASGNVCFASYADSSGSPSSKRVSSSSTAAATGWNEHTVTATFHDALQHWIGIHTDNGTLKSQFTTESGNYYKTTTYPTFPDPITSPTSYGNKWSGVWKGVETQGYWKGTKITVPGSGSKPALKVAFYAHASGNVILSIFDSSGNRLWYSGSTAVAVGWNFINISAGTPTSLNLTGGSSYYPGWQINSVADIPSYVGAGASGDGVYVVMSYATPPSSVTFVNSTEKWAMYVTVQIE